MSGISGPGGSNLRTGGVDGVEPPSGGADADAGSPGTAAAGAAPRTRPRSLDAQGIGLAASLHASFEASASAGPVDRNVKVGEEGEWIRPLEKAPETPAELAAAIASLKRTPPNDIQLDGIKSALAGRVTTKETKALLKELEDLPPSSWLGTIDKLKATPSDEKGLSLLDKFVKYGVGDRNKFIAGFADQANRKLGAGLPTLWDRAEKHMDEGMRRGQAKRAAAREVRSESDVLLEYFNSKDRMGFVNGLRAVGAVPAAIGEGIVKAPLALLQVLVLLKS